MSTKSPKVSIVTITYNQEKYIRETLESLVMQKTDFTYEIIVADDGSKDKTPDIIREFDKKHPGIFKPILRKKNIGAIANSVDSLRAAKGKYIALCEGDDYWTDENKLQLQADFLDKNPEYALCFHPVLVFYENKEEKDLVFPENFNKPTLSVTELLKQNLIQTNSVMYRRLSYKNIPEEILPLDWYLHVYHAQSGKIGFINRVMAAYRRHAGGVWWDAYKDIDGIWRKYGIPHLGLFVEMLKLYGGNDQHKKIILSHIDNMISTLVRVDIKFNEALIKKAINKYPNVFEPYFLNLYQELEDKTKTLHEKEQEIINFKHIIELRDEEIRQKVDLIKHHERELHDIKSSKFWKLRNVAVKLRGKKDIK